MQYIRAVVFDLDGTLVDSLEDIASVVNATLVAHGRPAHPLEAYNAMVGWGLKSLLVKASSGSPFATEELPAIYEELMNSYRSRPVVNTKPYVGIVRMLESLGNTVPLGVFSNKEEGMTRTIVSKLFSTERFDSVLGSLPSRPPKPDPTGLLAMLEAWGVAPETCAFLGDSDVDMETANRAGVVACGAAWGFRGAEELRSAGAAEVFSDADAFQQWLLPRLGPSGP